MKRQPKIINVDSKPKNIIFDDIIRGVYTQAKYTHDVREDRIREYWNESDKDYRYTVSVKQFLISFLINDEWVVQPFYIGGLSSAIKMINARDLKLLKMINK